MKKNKSTWSLRMLGTAMLSLSPAAFAGIVSDNFESYTPGQTIPGQTFEPGYDATQKDYIKATAGTGVSGSQGATFDAANVSSTYNVTQTTAVGGSGATVYKASTKFKMSINDLVPALANHGTIGVGLSTTGNWYDGRNIVLTLVRRDAGKSFGITGIGSTTAAPQPWNVTGWETNTKIGLPAVLPTIGNTATSGWFTLSLTVTDTGTFDSNSPPRRLWNVKGEVLDSAGAVAFTHNLDRVITTNSNNPNDVAATDSFVPGANLYGMTQVAWITSNTYKSLQLGGVSGLVADDLASRSLSASVDFDGDGLNEIEEFNAGTDDTKVDTDGDTYSDYAEVITHLTNPLDIDSYPNAPVGVRANYNTRPLGPPSTTLWNTKWDGSNPSQRNLWAVTDNGVSGTRGYSLDVTKAWRSYNTVNVVAASQPTAVLQSDFRFSTTGAPIDESGSSGINGVNGSLFGLQLKNVDNWWNITGTDFTLARRHNDYFGFLINGNIEGWIANSEVGLSPGLTASTSGWFTMRLELTESIATPGTYVGVLKAIYQGNTFFTSSTVPISAAIAVGSPIYGGLSNGYNNNASNTGAPPVDPADTAPAMPVGSIGKISSVHTDNFSVFGFNSAIDTDGDTLNQAQEGLLGTSDVMKDTDGDGFDDNVEVAAGTNPLNNMSFPTPEIAVEQPVSTDIANNGSKDFGSVAVGSNTSLVFTIRNTGIANLTGLAITKSGANAAEFTVTASPVAPVAAPGTTTFTVQFAPAAAGARAAAISIANNDTDENPFVINLTGTATASGTPYSTWATSKGLTTGVNDGASQDPDKDGVSNLLEFVLVGEPLASSTAVLPVQTVNATDVILTFKRSTASIGNTTTKVVTSAGLGSWADFATVGSASAGPVVVAGENITVTIPRSLAVGGKLFARVLVNQP